MSIKRFIEPAVALCIYLVIHSLLYSYSMIGKELTFFNFALNGLLTNALVILLMAIVRPAYWVLKISGLIVRKFISELIKAGKVWRGCDE